ncbi:MAG: anthranilate phosphoribosyltransferase, partial [Tannerella sp.]|nr:anthranilate phosphoribosyltransferase [Tannerella sp.]
MKEILYRLFDHQYLGRAEAERVLADIAEGKYNNEQVSA